MQKSKNKASSNWIIRCLTLFILFGLCLGLGFFIISGLQVHIQVRELFGEPASELSLWQQIPFEIFLFIHKDELLTTAARQEKSLTFTVEPNENVYQILDRLQTAHLIQDTNSLRIYLKYSGLDKRILAGDHQINGGLTPIQIAQALTSQTNMLVQFTILPGWRMEEIAKSLEASGIVAHAQDFLQFAQQPLRDYLADIPPNDSVTSEGFLFPDTYSLRHQENSEILVRLFTNQFQKQLSPEIIEGIRAQGFTIYQAVILASIIQRETILIEEMPLIASVYLNRLNADMKLDSDPTVQYAIGYNQAQNTWWTNPLSERDLQIDSPYNTYLYKGLPPSPICNPSIDALLAVAQPAKSDYLYFRAACDQSGRHIFSRTYQEHLEQACP